MESKSHIRSATHLKNYFMNQDQENTRTSSLSTSYQSETDKLFRIDTIEDNIPDNMSTSEPLMKQDSLKDYTSYYSKILSYLLAKSEALESEEKFSGLMNVIFSDFCNIENQYIQRLRVLEERIDPTNGIYSKDLQSALSSFKTYIGRLAENHEDFMEAVSSECLLETTNQILYDINKEINKLKKELDNYKSDRIYYISEMKESYYKGKSAVSLFLNSTHQAPSIKTSVHKTIIPTILNFININNIVYENAEFNYYINFNNRVDVIVNMLVELDKRRSSELSGVLSKFVVYETAKLRNVQYDLNKLIDKLNKEEPSKDFREEYMNNQKILMPKKVPPNHIELEGTEVDQVFTNGLSYTQIQPPSFKVISKIENNMQGFIDLVWGEKQASSLMEFSEQIQSSLVRQIFCDMLSKIATSNPELESKDKFQLLADMVSLVLLISERQSDYWSGYSVIKFSDKFHTLVENLGDNRCYLWAMICRNDYWKNIKFWEELLTIIISLDLKALFETVGCLNREVRKVECVPSTEEPSSFKEWTVKYGIPPAECEEIVNRVCSRHKIPESYKHYLIHK